jgi:hypothetical protein
VEANMLTVLLLPGSDIVFRQRVDDVEFRVVFSTEL